MEAITVLLKLFLFLCMCFLITFAIIYARAYKKNPQTMLRKEKKLAEKFSSTENFFYKIRKFNDKLQYYESKMAWFWFMTFFETGAITIAALFIGKYIFKNAEFKLIWNYASYIISAIFFMIRLVKKYYKKKNNINNDSK